MATFTRRNSWNNNGTFDNPDLHWYALGVREMQSRSLDDPTSWWFFAAIHGQYVTTDTNSGTQPPADYRNWANIRNQPQVPTAPLPSADSKKMYWDQCQHGTWYFLPWHRGYLYAIENILREIILNLGGPEDWSLPYWDYFGPSMQRTIPPAFAQKTLPDGNYNPLYVKARYGYNNDGIISIPLIPWDINENCQQKADFTGSQPNYYGGEESGFQHSKYADRGSLENNPHNLVHGAVGGQTVDGLEGGLMGHPKTAALDPIFYLHHCNIDRMWAAWNKSGKSNPTAVNWLKGPTSQAERKFCMPMPDKTSWPYTPQMVDGVGQLDYTYENLELVSSPMAFSALTKRLRNFGLKLNEIEISGNMGLSTNSELVGANSSTIKLDAAGARTTVTLDSKGWSSVAKNLTTFEASFEKGFVGNKLPDQVFLQLEGVKGNEDSIVCLVSVNSKYVGHVSLFGLRDASVKDGHHGGAGLTVILDISKIVDELHINNSIDVNSLDVLIQPANIVAQGNEVTIDRVSVYRQTQL